MAQTGFAKVPHPYTADRAESFQYIDVSIEPASILCHAAGPAHIVRAPKAQHPMAAAVLVHREQTQAMPPPGLVVCAQSVLMSSGQKLPGQIRLSSYRGSDQKGRELGRQALLTACKDIVEVFPNASAYFCAHTRRS